MSEASDTLLLELRKFGLGFPGAESASPWPGHDDLRVNDKTFAFLSVEGEPFSLSCKLAYTAAAALELPYASPTHYGLGKWGWVTLRPDDDQMPSLEQLKEWVEESYRSQAPRKLVKELDARADRADS
jgi:predicted DNA-binding protein (MmcQ/YjbR family)